MVPASTSRVPGAKLCLRSRGLSCAIQQRVNGTPSIMLTADAVRKDVATVTALSTAAQARAHRIEAMKCSVSILMSTNTYMQGRLVTSTGTRLRQGGG